MPDEWNDQVLKQRRTFLDGKWDGRGQNQLKPATRHRLTRDQYTNPPHWMRSADSFLPRGGYGHRGTSATKWQVETFSPLNLDSELGLSYVSPELTYITALLRITPSRGWSFALCVPKIITNHNININDTL